jgi:uncharacterized protein
MPEYLAPGVYVEETSFRAKSIEGVSTSTTAFVGPTRRGPVTGTPDLITSYADFERVYGGHGRVHGMENHLAHGVRAYFNEGGARLYVARFFTAGADDGRARSGPVAAGGPGTPPARFVARFPGVAGNGRVTLRRSYQPASAETMIRAEPGTLLRTGGDRVAAPARIASSRPGPWSLQDADTLILSVGTGAGDPQTPTITFRGRAARVEGKKFTADTELAAGEAGRRLTVTVDGDEQVVVLPAGTHTPEQIVEALNAGLEGVAVSLKEDGTLVLETTRRGAGTSLSAVGGTFVPGGANGRSDTVPEDANNNVADLGAVTLQELARLLEPHGVEARVREGQLELSTAALGQSATLGVGAGTANAALGLTATPGDAPARGVRGGRRGWYRLAGTKWIDSGATELAADALADGADFVTLIVETQDGDGQTASYEGLALGPEHPQYLGNVLTENPSRRSDWLEQGYAFTGGGSFDALQLNTALFAASDVAAFDLTGGSDGDAPTGLAYAAALERLLPLEDISILAAPGHTAYAEGWDAIQRVLIAHVERPRSYQILVLDSRPEGGIAGAREVRGGIDSKYAALYFPWVTIANPAWRPGRADLRREIDVPPSGFLAGVYARNDVQRGVHKAPANEVVRSALRFEEDINFAEQGVLNPVGVNCLRFFPGRGYRVWGARTVSSDPEWKYVSVRRYFNYVERSIDVGTQWAVFEPNGEALWANIRSTVSSFLYNEWRNGALLGTDPKEAYFVRCDRSTMTQNDLDNGRLVCLVGMAVVKPAEFVIFRIGQKTADARD